MRRRWPILLGASLLGLGILAFAGWPMLESAVGRAVEERLRQETGQDWKVGGGAGLTLRPTPQLTLHDLKTGSGKSSDRFTATIRRVRLSDPWSMLTGGSAIGIVAEGIELRAPLADAAAMPSFKGVSEVRAALDGAKIEPDPSGKSVTLTAESLDLGLRIGSSDTVRIDAQVALPGHQLTLAGQASRNAGRASATPVKLTLAPRDGTGHRLEADARAVVEASQLRLDDIKGTIDEAPFSGRLALEIADKPRITADFALDALTLRLADLPSPAKSANGLVVALPTDVVPLPSWFEGYEARGTLRFGRLTIGPVLLESAQLKADVKNGSLDLALTGADAYGGKARGRYVVQPESGEAGRHEFSLSTNGLGVRAVLSDVIGARGIDGTGGLRLDLRAVGNQPASLRQSLKGSAELIVKDGRLNGLDLAGLAGLVPKGLRGAPEVGALATRLDTLTGSFAIADGRAVTNDLEIRTSILGAQGIGSIDLVGQTFDLHLKPQIGSGDQPGRGRLDVPIRISGPWANPSISTDLSKVMSDPRGAIDSIQELGTKLLGERGGQLREDLGGLIDSFIPKQDRAPAERPRR